MNGLEQIKARLEAATLGPWEVEDGEPSTGVKYIVCPADVAVARIHNLTDGKVCANSELIAHAPEDMSRLIARVERLETALTTIESEYVTDEQEMKDIARTALAEEDGE